MKKCIIRQMFFEKQQRKHTWLGILCSVCMVLSLVLAIPVTALAGDTAITSVTIVGVDTDLNTSKNFTMGSVTSGDTSKYEIVFQSWDDGCVGCSSNSKPESNNEYCYWAKLRAKDGFYFLKVTNSNEYGGTVYIGGEILNGQTYFYDDGTLGIQTVMIKPTTGGTTGEKPSGGSETEGGGSGTEGGNTETGGSSGNNGNTSNSTSHTHSFAWCTITEPTAEQDGLEAYACTSCGYYEESVPVSAYSYACHGGGKTGDLRSTGL